MANFVNINGDNSGELYLNLNQVLFLEIDRHRGEEFLKITFVNNEKKEIEDQVLIRKIKNLLNLKQ